MTDPVAAVKVCAFKQRILPRSPAGTGRPLEQVTLGAHSARCLPRGESAGL